MPWFEFACPHCSQLFRLENPPAGQQVECPDCGNVLALPAELPSPAAPSELPDSSDAGAAEADADSAFDFVRPTLSMAAGRANSTESRDEPVPAVAQKPAAIPPVIRTLSREEKAQRRQRRNLILMFGGLIVLVVVLLVLSGL